MGQKLRNDKIGTLSHSSGVVTLGASYLTIGGQQYTVSGLSRTITADVTLVANTLYMIYAVLSGGVPVLRVSANVNSLGPAGFVSWKLVGAFYSDGESSVSLGSFVNISGVPKTNNPITSTLNFFANAGATGWANGPRCAWSRDGRMVSMTMQALKDGVAGSGAGAFGVTLPTNFPSFASAGNSIGAEIQQQNGGSIGYLTFLNIGSADWTSCELYVVSTNELNCLNQPTGTGTLQKTAIAANCVIQGFMNNIPLAGWNNTAIEDL